MLQGFGYLRDERDERDHLWGAVVGLPAEPLPQIVSHESIIGPPYDQGQTSECTCYSLCGLKAFEEYKQHRKLMAFDPGDLYKLAKAVDGHPNEPGTYLRTVLDILKKQGAKLQGGKTRYKIAAYTRLGSVDEIRHALHASGPVAIGIRINVAAWSILAGDMVVAQTNSLTGGHALLAVGYDDTEQRFRLRNSWSDSWGDEGHCWLPYAYLSQSDPEFDAWSVTDA